MRIVENLMKSNLLILFSFLFLIISKESFATDQFEYPELNVVPKSSDRLAMEARKESDGAWNSYLPIQISGLSTLVAGITSSGSASNSTSYIGMGVGATWLVLGTALSLTSRPYASATQRIGIMPKGNVRDQLTRERLAEEEIEKIASMGEKIRWLSVLTNVGASAMMLADKGSSPKSDLMLGCQIASGILSLTPLVFRFHSKDVADQQKEYKKRIYSPVAQATVLSDGYHQNLIPGMMLSLRF